MSITFDDFIGYSKEYIIESRPKLISFEIQPDINNNLWKFINIDSKESFDIQITDSLNHINSLHAFLTELNAYDEYTYPRTDKHIDWAAMAAEVYTKGKASKIWIPENKISILITKKIQSSDSKIPIEPISIADEEPKTVGEVQKKVNDIVNTHLTPKIMTEKESINFIKEYISEQIKNVNSDDLNLIMRYCRKEALEREINNNKNVNN
jgi:hypothetical protein